MGKSTISMAIFNSYVKLPEGIPFLGICVAVRLCKRWSKEAIQSTEGFRFGSIWKVVLETNINRRNHYPPTKIHQDHIFPMSNKGKSTSTWTNFLWDEANEYVESPGSPPKSSAFPWLIFASKSGNADTSEMAKKWNKMMKPWILGPPFVSHGDTDIWQ